MFSNFVPNFARGSILKKEMLENLRDYPRDLMNIYYRDASNGIISGCDIKIDGYEIIISEGIIKHNNKIYTLRESFSIPYENYSKEMTLKVRFLDEETDSSFLKFQSQVFLDDNLELMSDEVELCRFKLKEGAKLRETYVDFADLSTEYNTVNIINVKFSGNEIETLHPRVIKIFSEALLKSGSKEYEDLLFAMLSLNAKLVERNLILQYINRKIGLDKKEYTNSDIYRSLLRIYRNNKDGKRPEPTNRQRPNVILVD